MYGALVTPNQFAGMTVRPTESFEDSLLRRNKVCDAISTRADIDSDGASDVRYSGIDPPKSKPPPAGPRSVPAAAAKGLRVFPPRICHLPALTVFATAASHNTNPCCLRRIRSTLTELMTFAEYTIYRIRDVRRRCLTFGTKTIRALQTNPRR